MAPLPERITIPITLDITVRTGMDTSLRPVAPEPLTVVDADGPMTDARRHALPRITVLHLRRGRVADLNQPGMPGWLLMRATWDPKGSPRIAHDGIPGGIAGAAEFMLGDPREHDSVDECDAYLISPAQS